jgi:hypothetical protein
VTVNEALKGESTDMATEARPELDAVRRMNAISTTREGAEALQRARMGQALSPSQAKLVGEYKALEQQHNATAKPVYTGGWMKGPRPYISSDAMAWVANPHKEQRRQLAAEWKAKTLADPNHDYWHADRGALHKSAMLAMKAAYEAAETGEVNSVQINPADGSIIEE